MVTTYKKPTKLQKETFEKIFGMMDQCTPYFLEQMTFQKRVALYSEYSIEIENAKHRHLLTNTQYDKLRSYLNKIASWIVEIPPRKMR